MQVTKNNFTDLELAILKACRSNDYGDAFAGESPWVFGVISASGLNPKIARGAISSLVKKGVLIIEDYEGRGKADDMVLSVSELALKLEDLER